MQEVNVTDTVVFEELVTGLQQLREALGTYAQELHAWIARAAEAFADELHDAQRAGDEATFGAERVFGDAEWQQEGCFAVPGEELWGHARSERARERADAWVEGAREACRRCHMLSELLSHSIAEAQADIDGRVFAGLDILQEAGSSLAGYVSDHMPPPLPMPVRQDDRLSLDFKTGNYPKAGHETAERATPTRRPGAERRPKPRLRRARSGTQIRRSRRD